MAGDENPCTSQVIVQTPTEPWLEWGAWGSTTQSLFKSRKILPFCQWEHEL